MESTPHYRSIGRVVIAFVVLLSFATGLVLGILVDAGKDPRASAIVPESEVLATGREYYRAVNLLLESGEDDDLRTILASDFRLRRLTSAEPGDANRLIGELSARASLHEDLTLSVDSIASVDDLVVANVRWSAGQSPVFAGLPVKIERAASFQEILRIREGRVVEHWSDIPSELQLSTIASVEEMSFSDIPTLRLWHIDPRAYLVLNAESSLVVIAERGSLTIETHLPGDGSIQVFRSDFAISRPAETVPASSEMVIREGDVLLVSGGVELRISNLEESPGTFFALSSESGEAGTFAPPQGFGPASSSWIVSRGAPIVGDPAPSTVSVGIARLREGEAFAHPGLDAGSEFVISIDGGLSITAPPSQVWTVDGQGTATAQETARIAIGNGAVILGASGVTYAPSEGRTCTFLVLTLVPEGR